MAASETIVRCQNDYCGRMTDVSGDSRCTFCGDFYVKLVGVCPVCKVQKELGVQLICESCASEHALAP